MKKAVTHTWLKNNEKTSDMKDDQIVTLFPTSIDTIVR